MNNKTTEWFPPEINPPVPGVYLVKVPVPVPMFAYWNGFKFGYRTVADVNGVKEAIRNRDRLTHLGDRATWCGLTQDAFLMARVW